MIREIVIRDRTSRHRAIVRFDAEDGDIFHSDSLGYLKSKRFVFVHSHMRTPPVWGQGCKAHSPTIYRVLLAKYGLENMKIMPHRHATQNPLVDMYDLRKDSVVISIDGGTKTLAEMCRGEIMAERVPVQAVRYARSYASAFAEMDAKCHNRVWTAYKTTRRNQRRLDAGY